MKQIYKLSVTGEQAKRVRAEIRERQMLRKLRDATEPSVKYKRALEDYYRDNDLLFEGRPKQIES